MAFSNKFNHLLLTTGNKSEIAVGYCTLYGDMCGGLAVISDVPKTMVWELSRWINAHAGRELIPRSSIEKVPSAELRPNQTDQDSLPPYDVLDAILYRYVEEEKVARRDHRRRVRRRDGDARDQADRPQRVQAPPGAAGAEGDEPRVRVRPADADRAELPAACAPSTASRRRSQQT